MLVGYIGISLRIRADTLSALHAQQLFIMSEKSWGIMSWLQNGLSDEAEVDYRVAWDTNRRIYPILSFLWKWRFDFTSCVVVGLEHKVRHACRRESYNGRQSSQRECCESSSSQLKCILHERNCLEPRPLAEKSQPICERISRENSEDATAWSDFRTLPDSLS